MEASWVWCLSPSGPHSSYSDALLKTRLRLCKSDLDQTVPKIGDRGPRNGPAYRSYEIAAISSLAFEIYAGPDESSAAVTRAYRPE